MDVLVVTLFYALIIFTLIVAYVLGVRPILKQNPTLKLLYETEDSIFAALAAKFSGVKQKLTTALISLAGIVVLAHDQIGPLLVMAGVDPQAIPAQILPKVPAWVWPVGTVGVLWLLQQFRNLADNQAKANAEALLKTGTPLAAPAPGIPVNTLPDKQDG
jgi:energy-converting hydrogenase Eha subunit A